MQAFERNVVSLASNLWNVTQKLGIFLVKIFIADLIELNWRTRIYLTNRSGPHVDITVFGMLTLVYVLAPGGLQEGSGSRNDLYLTAPPPARSDTAR